MMSVVKLEQPVTWFRGVVVLALLVACAVAAPAGMQKDLQLLRESPQREALAAAALRIAASGDPDALLELGRLLPSRPFLARLDDLDAPQAATFNVRRVFLALAARPSKVTEAVCLKAIASSDFIDDPARMRYALEALAAVQPMSPDAAAVFQRMNQQDFFAFNGPLLAGNGSERAIAVLESMFADHAQSAIERVAMAREAVVPNRIKRSIVDMVDRLREHGLETAVLLALAECIFEYRPDEWYGKRRDPPQAPAWSTAAQQARKAAVALGRRLLERDDLPASLRAAIETATKP